LRVRFAPGPDIAFGRQSSLSRSPALTGGREFLSLDQPEAAALERPDATLASAEAFLYAAAIMLLTRRLAGLSSTSVQTLRV
jgi:hypothetical protein